MYLTSKLLYILNYKNCNNYLCCYLLSINLRNVGNVLLSEFNQTSDCVDIVKQKLWYLIFAL